LPECCKVVKRRQQPRRVGDGHGDFGPPLVHIEGIRGDFRPPHAVTPGLALRAGVAPDAVGVRGGKSSRQGQGRGRWRGGSSESGTLDTRLVTRLNQRNLWVSSFSTLGGGRGCVGTSNRGCCERRGMDPVPPLTWDAAGSHAHDSRGGLRVGEVQPCGCHTRSKGGSAESAAGHHHRRGRLLLP
jgi:hypothetical protein